MAITYRGDEGRNNYFGNAEATYLYGLGGNDLLYGGKENDTLIGGSGNDTLAGGAGRNIYVMSRGDGEDEILLRSTQLGETGFKHYSVLQFGENIAAADIVANRTPWGSLELAVSGGGERVTIRDYFLNSNANGSLERQFQLQEVRFADGSSWSVDDVLRKVSPVQLLGDGNDQASGSALDGQGGDDLLIGRHNNALLLGGAGNDTLQGGYGDNVLDGGSGNDLLSGRDNVTYRFTGNWGQDTIALPGNPGSVRSLLELPGTTASALSFARSGDGLDLLVALKGGTGSITVSGYFDSLNAGMAGKLRIALANGDSLDAAAIAQALAASPLRVLAGGPGNDTIADYYYVDNLIDGGAGDDMLDGGAGNDVLLGGDGSDMLHGGQGDDILDAGPGNAVLIGAGGNNVYRFGREAGTYQIGTQGDGTHTLLVAGDVQRAEVQVALAGDMVEVSIAGSAAMARFQALAEYSDGVSTLRYPVQVQFADGTVWDQDALQRKLNQGDAKVNVLNGGEGPDILSGFGGGDRLDGRGGEDTLRGGSGDDGVHGGDGHDALFGDDGNDLLFGEEGDDMLRGGAGDDELSGGGGSNTYQFARGDGKDQILAHAASAMPVKQVIEFLGDIAPAEVSVHIAYRDNGSPATLMLGVGGDQVSVAIDVPYNGVPAPLPQVRFADGSSWDSQAILARSLIGDAGDNVLAGGAGADLLEGRGGNDVLHGGAGNDTLSGGEGDDALWGDGGNDVFLGGRGNDALNGGGGTGRFLVNRGDGMDTIYGLTSGSVIRFGDGIAAADVARIDAGGLLSLAYGSGQGAADVLRIESVDGGYWQSIQHEIVVEFADSSVLPLSAFSNRAPAQAIPLAPLPRLQEQHWSMADQYALDASLAATGTAPPIVIVGASGSGAAALDFLPAGSLNDGSPLFY